MTCTCKRDYSSNSGEYCSFFILIISCCTELVNQTGLSCFFFVCSATAAIAAHDWYRTQVEPCCVSQTLLMMKHFHSDIFFKSLLCESPTYRTDISLLNKCAARGLGGKKKERSLFWLRCWAGAPDSSFLSLPPPILLPSLHLPFLHY